MSIGRAWISDTFGNERCGKVATFIDAVIKENGSQNLIAPSTVDAIWERHALDSAQLLTFDQPGVWIDVGTGGGFPGMIVALLRTDPVVLVEPRARRASFLCDSVNALQLDHVTVIASKIETLNEQASVISARAVASVTNVLRATHHLARSGTRWILPRGKSVQVELVEVRRNWHGVFHVEQSLSDEKAGILIIDKVRPK